MTAKQYLSQIKLLNLKIDQKLEEREDLMFRAMGNHSPTLTKDKVQSSISGDRMSSTVDRYVDLDRDIDQLIRKYVDKRDLIINQIQQLEDPRCVELLYHKYVGHRNGEGRMEYMRLEEIACIMKKPNGSPYTYGHIRSLHGKALKDFGIMFLINVKYKFVNIYLYIM